jgi:hypothetical protein
MAPIRDESKDVIKAGAKRLTSGGTVAAAIVALIAGIDPVFDKVTAVTDQEVSDALRLGIVITAIATWGVLASVDILARAYATAHSAAKIAELPRAVRATVTKGHDKTGYNSGRTARLSCRVRWARNGIPRCQTRGGGEMGSHVGRRIHARQVLVAGYQTRWCPFRENSLRGCLIRA